MSVEPSVCSQCRNEPCLCSFNNVGFSRSQDKRLAAQENPMEPSKWALERARKFLDGVRLVDKNSDDVADRAARFSLALEFDAIARERHNVIGAGPVCVDCNNAGLRNCSHFDDCDGHWIYKSERDEAAEKLAEALQNTLSVLAFESTIRRNAVGALAEWRERMGQP